MNVQQLHLIIKTCAISAIVHDCRLEKILFFVEYLEHLLSLQSFGVLNHFYVHVVTAANACFTDNLAMAFHCLIYGMAAFVLSSVSSKVQCKTLLNKFAVIFFGLQRKIFLLNLGIK